MVGVWSTRGRLEVRKQMVENAVSHGREFQLYKSLGRH